MRARMFIIPLFIGGLLCLAEPAHADSTLATCDVLDTSTTTQNNAYAVAYCGVQTASGGNTLATSTLYAIELNIATNAGDTEYLMFTTGGPNFVGQSYNDYGQQVTLTGLGTGLHTFVLTTPITFPAGVVPSLHLYQTGANGFGRSLGYGQPNSHMYGSNVGNGQQAVFYQKWFWTPAVGTLHVVKHVANDNGGTATAGQWVMNISASSSPNHFAGSESGADVAITPGAYSVTASGGPSGYASSSSPDCTGSISAWQAKTCTITDDDAAPLLTLIKEVVNGFGGTALASAWTLLATGSTTISGATPVVSGPTFFAGSYLLSETSGPANYALSLGCVKNGGATTTSNTLALAAGDTATCIFKNTQKQPGILHVIEHVVNDNPEGFQGTATSSDFMMHVIGGNANPASFAGSEAGVAVTIDAGATFSVSETGAQTANYGMSQGEGSACSGTMLEGGSLTCTIINNDNPPTTGGLTVTKVVIDDNGGTKTISDFPLQVNGLPVTSGQNNQFAGGNYTVTETGDARYTATFSGDCNSNGVVTVVNGQFKACTITNDDMAPRLTVVKVVVNDDGGTKQISDFPLFIDSARATSGIATTTTIGAHTVTETNDPGYTAAFSGDCDSSGHVTLAVGDIKACTITNDDMAPPPPPTPSTNGGGGSPGAISPIFSSGGSVLGVSCGLYMNQHLKKGSAKNKPDQVMRLQQFLNKNGFGTFVPNGYFGSLTLAAAKAFQSKYADQILKPWNISRPTGLVYLTTIRQLNLIECPDLTLSLPALVPWNANPTAQ